MIIKLQRPIWTSGEEQDILIYNKHRSIMFEWNTPELNELFGSDEYKIYHHAHMKGTLLHIGKRAPDQDW